MFYIRQPLAFLSLCLYDTPGLAPRMNGNNNVVIFKISDETTENCCNGKWGNSGLPRG